MLNLSSSYYRWYYDIHGPMVSLPSLHEFFKPKVEGHKLQLCVCGKRFVLFMRFTWFVLVLNLIPENDRISLSSRWDPKQTHPKQNWQRLAQQDNNLFPCKLCRLANYKALAQSHSRSFSCHKLQHKWRLSGTFIITLKKSRQEFVCFGFDTFNL